jgi:paraquat-inducible protein B
MTTTNHINHMKNKALFLFLITAGILAVGCEKKRTTSEQLDRVQTKTAEVAQNMRDFTFAEKDEFVAKMRAELAELNRNLDELAAKVEKSSTAVKSDAQARIAGLREHTARLNKQLDEATNATVSNWDKFKADVRKTSDASKQEFKEARQWLSDKIAP